jgi:DNA repair protein RecN (Recombination protein N)
VEALQQEMDALAAQYGEKAGLLGKKRRQAARKLEKSACQTLASLSMERCQFEIALPPRESTDPHPLGGEDVEFLISTNPGSPAQTLGKIASGGELSRISLAIQVVTASASPVASMVFDEVDVGIGGAVAEVVGRLLRQLAEDAQVLCVTHLPQVAAQGEHHLQVSKTGDRTSVQTRMQRLGDEDKIREIARMLGGVKITEQTLAHAREMLAL